jgi:methylenetetrahydrofolate reductase (NADPH)
MDRGAQAKSVSEMNSNDLKHTVNAFTRVVSTEISTHDEDLLPALANTLPAGTTVYVAHTPKASLGDVVRVAVKIQSLGFRASPHIVARRQESEHGLKAALDELKQEGVEQVLLVAGDLERPLGKFSSTLEIIDSELLERAGIKRVGVAGHPEGHKSIGPTKLLTALRDKQAFAQRTGINVHIVTQFGFSPEAVCAWERHLAKEGIALPIHVGIAGPTPLPKLIKFAMQCGVAASLHSLMKNMSAMSNLARLATSPDKMLLGLIHGRAACSGSHLMQPHFYAFGGALATATWLRAVIDGRFTVEPDGQRFVLSA